MRILITLLCVLGAGYGHAATVTRCVDAAGKVTFSQHGCPSAAVETGVVNAENLPPRGSGPAATITHDIPLKGLGGLRVSGTAEPEPAAAPAPAEPRQENTPYRRGAQAPQNCVRWVDQRVDCSRTLPDGTRRGCSQTIKVARPC